MCLECRENINKSCPALQVFRQKGVIQIQLQASNDIADKCIAVWYVHLFKYSWRERRSGVCVCVCGESVIYTSNKFVSAQRSTIPPSKLTEP